MITYPPSKAPSVSFLIFPEIALYALVFLLQQSLVVSVSIALHFCHKCGSADVVEGDDVNLVVALAVPVMANGGNPLFLANLLAEVLLQYQAGVVVVVALYDFKQQFVALHLHQRLVGQDEAEPKAQEAILYAPPHIADARLAEHRLELAHIIVVLIQVLEISACILADDVVYLALTGRFRPVVTQ